MQNTMWAWPASCFLVFDSELKIGGSNDGQTKQLFVFSALVKNSKDDLSPDFISD